jgi:Rps23 Pro-64 3,4-dihydroxylase Tpa1-like proline 4-hydroxylase
MLSKLEDYIIVIENAITPALCDAVLAEYKNSSDWIDACIENGVDRAIRNCSTIGMSFDNIIEKNKEVRKVLDKYMHVSVAAVIEKYRKNFSNCTINYDTGYDILRYEEGGFYTEHVDSFTSTPRAVSCSLVLNDEYEGGEFAFFNRGAVYKLKKGSCIMFPSNFMYPHEIMPVTSGTRYSIVTWFV